MFLREAREIFLSKAWHHLHAKYKYETGKGTLWNYVMFFYARRVKEPGYGYMCKIVEDMLIFKIILLLCPRSRENKMYIIFFSLKQYINYV